MLDLAAVKPGMAKSEVARRLGPGIPKQEVPEALFIDLDTCQDPWYYKVVYKVTMTRVIHEKLGEPGTHLFWRVCFNADVVEQSHGLGIVTH